MRLLQRKVKIRANKNLPAKLALVRTVDGGALLRIDTKDHGIEVRLSREQARQLTMALR